MPMCRHSCRKDFWPPLRPEIEFLFKPMFWRNWRLCGWADVLVRFQTSAWPSNSAPTIVMKLLKIKGAKPLQYEAWCSAEAKVMLSCQMEC